MTKPPLILNVMSDSEWEKESDPRQFTSVVTFHDEALPFTSNPQRERSLASMLQSKLR